MIWLIGDTHFYHENIIKYCLRPFANAEEMNEVLVANWNETVQPEDTIYHLGDVAFVRKDSMNEIVSRLNGHKILIRGNHDKGFTDTRFHEAGFEEIYKDALYLEKYNVILSHRPLEDTLEALNIHGHIHNSDPYPKYPWYSTKTHVCVSVELTRYRPISLDTILKEMGK